MRELTKKERFASVWDATEDDRAVAENLRLRSSLMLALKRQIEVSSKTGGEPLWGYPALRISKLMHGKINAFGLDLLVRMASTAGLHVSIKIKKAA